MNSVGVHLVLLTEIASKIAVGCMESAVRAGSVLKIKLFVRGLQRRVSIVHK
jgi:hypothetical protein